MQVICNHVGTEHCKKVKKIWRGCWHSKSHECENCHTGNHDMDYFTCRDVSGSFEVKCIPYQEEIK
jgi:hypothetical protein